MSKWLRTYTLLVDGRTQNSVGNTTVHSISFPLTCRFQIIKDVQSSLGTAIFRIYNLAADVRADIYRDAYEFNEYNLITFSAGYQNEVLPVIFQGSIKQAFSYREGPDWITEIEAYDGGSDVEYTLATVAKPSGYFKRDLALDIIGQFPNLICGALGNLDLNGPNTVRGITLDGNAWDLLIRNVRPANGFCFINNQKVYIMNQDEYVDYAGLIEEINADTGIIGSPKLIGTQVKVKMLLEPRMEPQQSVHLTTLIARMTGDYTVGRIIHSGVISGAVCEDAYTEATLFQPDGPVTEVAQNAT